jgi:hypothetical protein
MKTTCGLSSEDSTMFDALCRACSSLCEFASCSKTIFLVYFIDNVTRMQYMNCAVQCTQCTGVKVGIGRVTSRRPSSWSRWVSCPACVQMAQLPRATFHHLIPTPTFHLYTVSMSTAKNITTVEGNVICRWKRTKTGSWESLTNGQWSGVDPCCSAWDFTHFKLFW